MLRRRSLAAIIAAAVFVSQVTAAAASTARLGTTSGGPAAAPIDRQLAKDLAAGRTDRIVVEFTAKADLRPATKVKDRVKRGQAVLDALTATAGASQRGAKAVASATKGVHATSYWLANVMVVSGDPATLTKLASKLSRQSGVKAIHAEKIYPLIAPIDPTVAVLAAAGDPEWGVAKIRADEAWEKGILGQGVVVGSIDTGVDYTHPALVGNYRGNDHDGTFSHDYNWWDPSGSCPDAAPCDDVAHGTHTMGTMVGGDGPGSFTPDIGVAPGAQWIAAKGCEDFGCSTSSLLSAGQFILAPTDLEGENPMPGLRPDVVNNSWGSGPDDPFYQATVQAWRAAGIIPIFSSGNPGPGCGDAGSPGDYLESFSVGATDIDDTIADFSGRGPSVFGKINPDVSAPGVDVVSSVPGGGYAAFSGTSMAAPHTAGTVALILSADQSLLGDLANFGPVTDAIRSTAVDHIDLTCGGDEDGDPNNTYGDGRIDAFAAADLVASGGTLSGSVTEAGSATPVAGAKVTADNGTRTFSTSTDASGDYEIFLAAGSYDINVTAFGFFPGSAPGVTIATDLTTDQDFSLDLLPRFTVSGTITSAESGAPIADVSVRAIGTPVAPVTSGVSGDYALELPIGEYTLRASADGCTETGSAEIISAGDDIDQDFALFRKLDDFGHACSPIAFDWVDAGGQTALFGDEIFGRLRLPFSFDFYGVPYDAVFLSDNGYLNFLEPSQFFFNPTAIPSGSAPNAAIYPFWRDFEIKELGGIDYATVGDSPNRAFVIEYSDVNLYGSTSTLDFEVKLWENGTIDFVYGANDPTVGDGRTATVGIENATGRDALQIGFFEQVLRSNSAIRITTVPTGFVDGTVTDVNDGEPIAGATVTAQPGGRTAKTGDDGTYHLRLLAGSYTLTAQAEAYIGASAPAVVVDDATATVDLSLAAPTAAADTTEITETVDFGEIAHRTVTLSNDGSATLAWEARERAREVVFPPLPEPTATITYKPVWGHQTKPAGLNVIRPADTFSFDFDTIINDPLGDNEGSVDVGAIDGGSDGSNAMGIRIHYSDDTPIDQAVGYVLLDTDQDPDTGLPPEELSGLPTQDVGVDYFLDLFFAQGPDPVALVVDANFEIVAEVPVTYDGQTAEIIVPLEALGGDDGKMNVATVDGDFDVPTDWAPDIGHGTIEPFSDAPWLSEDPVDGSLEPGNDQAIEVTLGGSDLTPGEYHAELVLVTTAPKAHKITIPVTLTVTLPEGFGAATGTVSDAHTGEPVADATVTAHAQWPAGTPRDFSATTAPDGTYKIVGPAGTWSTDYALDGWLPVTQDITIAAGVTTPGADAALHRIQPHAALEGDVEPAFILLPGGTDGTTVTLSNPEGHADLTFTVNEKPLGTIIAGMGVATPTVGVTSSTRASAGHTARVVTPSISGQPSLVLEDTLPWDSDAIQQVLDANGVPFDQAGSGDIASLDLSGYHAIYVGNDQPQSFYEELAANEAKITDWVNDGGFLWFGAAAFGSQGSDLDGAVLPGGLTIHGPEYEEQNSVAAPDHPLMAGLPDPFTGNFASHVTFSDLPDGATVIARGANTGEPTLVDYDLGAGHVVAVGQPVEFAFGDGLDPALILQNGVPFAEAFTGFAEVPWLSESVTEGTIAPDGSMDIGISVDATGLEPGVYRAMVVIRTNDPDNAAKLVRVTLIVPEFQQGVNSGGKEYVAPNGTVYAADQEYKPAPAGLAAPGGPGGPGGHGGTTTFGYVHKGQAHSTKTEIEGTDEDARYQDLREDARGYRFEVPNGTYQVDLSFAEFKAKKVGERVFGVTIEGDEVIAALDVYRRAGGKFIALDRTFIVTVSDGVLDIDFPVPKDHKSIINSILVSQLPEGSPGT